MKSRLNAYFDTAACAADLMQAPPFGISSRNLVRGPGQNNVDLSVIRHFRATEKRNVEFRTEFFNVFSTVTFALPNNNATVPSTLRRITSTSTGPRVTQFALTYNF
ncbi:MAG: hypothetical protein ABSH28_13270 [Acidobacteriota bacterium]